MKNILLIEDRIGRQKHFLSTEEIAELKELVSSDNLPIRRIIEKLNCSEISQELESANLISIHKSALNSEGLRQLLDYCKSHQKDLILFTGGISQISYSNEGFQLLILNSKDFYSNLLLPFLRDYKKVASTNLLKLVYGDSWKLSFMLQYRNYKKLYENEGDLYKKEELLINLQTIKKIIPESIDNLDEKINSIISSL
ncbi:hypothetical protein [Maribellus mangrovi]|uniref:hypothetical protein n=1 Tax=Maribellus mangrovi TaxID=3133146 RepID=UPI0030EF52F0